MTQPGTKSSGSDMRGTLTSFAGFPVSPQVAQCVRLISARRGVSLSFVYRQAVREYLAGVLESLESEPVAGLAGQGDVELAAALRAAVR